MRGGSIGYAAPEQWLKAGKELDGRTDLYSLGATMYRMLTGQMPYPGVFDAGEFIGRTFAGPPKPVREVRAEVPEALAGLVGELLAVKVEERPRDAGLVIARLEEMQRPVPMQAPTVALPPPARTLVENPLPRPPPRPQRVTVPAPPLLATGTTTGATARDSTAAPRNSSEPRASWRGHIWQKGLLAILWAPLVSGMGLAALAVLFGWAWWIDPFPFAPSKTNETTPKQADAPHPPRPAILKERTNPKDGLKYVLIPAGAFTMGCSPWDGECQKDEKPTHEVQISKDFWLGQTEVTQGAFFKVTGERPSHFKGDEQLPVEQVSWEDAKQYCETIDGRLPTEAEWEYAARGDGKSAQYGDLNEIAWHASNSLDRTHSVGQKTFNGFHLYDMLGNVWERTADWYGPFQSAASIDPNGPKRGYVHVVRGGAWFASSSSVRVSSRSLIPSSASDACWSSRAT